MASGRTGFLRPDQSEGIVGDWEGKCLSTLVETRDWLLPVHFARAAGEEFRDVVGFGCDDVIG